MHIIAFSCIFLLKNKNNLSTFEARGTEIFQHIEPRPKFTGSYKKECICKNNAMAVRREEGERRGRWQMCYINTSATRHQRWGLVQSPVGILEAIMGREMASDQLSCLFAFFQPPLLFRHKNTFFTDDLKISSKKMLTCAILSQNFWGWGQIFLVNYNLQTYGLRFSSPFFPATPTFPPQKHFFYGRFKNFE